MECLLRVCECKAIGDPPTTDDVCLRIDIDEVQSISANVFGVGTDPPRTIFKMKDRKEIEVPGFASDWIDEYEKVVKERIHRKDG